MTEELLHWPGCQGKKEVAVLCLDTALGSFQTSQYLPILIGLFSSIIKILSIWTSTDLGWFSTGNVQERENTDIRMASKNGFVSYF